MIKEQIRLVITIRAVPTYSITFNKHAYKAALICRSEANLKVNNKKEREREKRDGVMGRGSKYRLLFIETNMHNLQNP